MSETSSALLDDLTDPLPLAQALVRCPSVTPEDAGALDVLTNVLTELGFVCHRLDFEEAGTEPVRNLYARWGTGSPHFCFAGHTDVVPVGENWTKDPFGAEVDNGLLYGRGASDMKGAIAAFVTAAADYIQTNPGQGSISLLITGDEEGPAINGTVKMVDWLKENGEVPDHCLVGEPTNPTTLGEMAKIGRRGSVNTVVTVHGTQGHAAYPHLADNPISRLVRILGALDSAVLDEGSEHFPPSTLALTTADVGNPTTNLIPAQASARFNIRFTDQHTGASLTEWIETTIREAAGDDADLEIETRVSGESFLTPPGRLSDLVTAACQEVLNRTPELSTTGGTSDARFIKDICPVMEFGAVGASMHKTDEHQSVDDLRALTRIYGRVLSGYFAG